MQHEDDVDQQLQLDGIELPRATIPDAPRGVKRNEYKQLVAYHPIGVANTVKRLAFWLGVTQEKLLQEAVGLLLAHYEREVAMMDAARGEDELSPSVVRLRAMAKLSIAERRALLGDE